MDVIAALNIDQTLVLFSSSLNDIWWALYAFIRSQPILASIYPIVVVILIGINYMIYVWHKTLIQRFVYEVDRMLYQASLVLHQAKPSLIRRKDQLDVLFINKKKMFAFDPKISDRTYTYWFDSLSKDVDYIEQLTQSVVRTPEQQQHIASINSSLQRSRIIYGWISWVISVMTLWIYSLLQNKMS